MDRKRLPDRPFRLIFFNILIQGHQPNGVVRAFGVLKQAAHNERRPFWTPRSEIKRSSFFSFSSTTFPLRVWQTGSGTQSNMNANEVIANRAIEMAGGVLGSKSPVHPNDHVNRAHPPTTPSPPRCTSPSPKPSSFEFILSVAALRDALAAKAEAWSGIVVGQPTSWTPCRSPSVRKPAAGWPNLDADLRRLSFAVEDLHGLALGGTAVGTGLETRIQTSPSGWPRPSPKTGLPFVSAPNKFAQLAAHDAVVAWASL